jgi:hypothetical protein
VSYLKQMYTMRRMEITCDTEYKVRHPHGPGESLYGAMKLLPPVKFPFLRRLGDENEGVAQAPVMRHDSCLSVSVCLSHGVLPSDLIRTTLCILCLRYAGFLCVAGPQHPRFLPPVRRPGGGGGGGQLGSRRERLVDHLL